MASEEAIIRSAFHSAEDESSGAGKRPVVFDILGPDWETSLLPEGSKLVLHVNPASMKISHQKRIERIQTRGGWVEQHWGDGVESVGFDMATGGFMRLYAGLSNLTGMSQGGSRRETIAYDKYLDMLALFQNNGSIYDSRGNVVLQGQVKITFDGGVFTGWFDTFSVQETADGPFQFKLSAGFTVHHEVMVFRSTLSAATYSDYNSEAEVREGAIDQAEQSFDIITAAQQDQAARRAAFFGDG
jgi:hypothetical protein